MNYKKENRSRFMIALLAAILVLSTTVGAFAATYTSSFSGEWYTGNGGSVNGSHNGAYHKLGPGTASITYTVNGATTKYPVYVQLKRAVTGFDINYGQVKITNGGGTKTFPTKTDILSSKYYIIASGGTHDTTHKISGKLKSQ